MRLICKCDMPGVDASSYAVLALTPRVAARLLTVRAALGTAKASFPPTQELVASGAGIPTFYWDGLPGDLEEDDLEAVEGLVGGVIDDEWIALPERWPGGREPKASADCEATVGTETDLYFTAMIGELRVETARMTWDDIQALAAGGDPWAGGPRDAAAEVARRRG